MRTSYRNIFLFAWRQAPTFINNAGLIAMNGLVGYTLAGSKSFATAAVTSCVLAAMPGMAKVGRRRGFMVGALLTPRSMWRPEAWE